MRWQLAGMDSGWHPKGRFGVATERHTNFLKEVTVSLDDVKDAIRGFSTASPSRYGATKSSLRAIEQAIKLAEAIERRTGLLPTLVAADGVILKYPKHINVEVADDGSVLLLDGMNNSWEYDGCEDAMCVNQVLILLSCSVGI